MKTTTLGISLVAVLALPMVLAANRATEAPTTARIKPAVTSVSVDGHPVADREKEDIVRKIKIYPLI